MEKLQLFWASGMFSLGAIELVGAYLTRHWPILAMAIFAVVMGFFFLRVNLFDPPARK